MSIPALLWSRMAAQLIPAVRDLDLRESSRKTSCTSGPLLLGAALLLGVVVYALPAASNNIRCADQTDSCDCGMVTPCWCCDEAGNFGESCGNCVWWAWHEACCHWDRGLPWCTHAKTWRDWASQNGYPLGDRPCNQSIFVCGAAGWNGNYGHVGWVTNAYADGSFDSTEMSCGGPCGVLNRHRDPGYATLGFIYNPAGGDCQGGQPQDNDDAAFVSESAPFDNDPVPAGTRFTKRWRMRNSGNTTWTRGGNYLWTFDGGERLGGPEQVLLGDGEQIGPGGEKEWAVELTAPQNPGNYKGFWKMDRFGTHRFGQQVWVQINVTEPADPDRDGDGSPASRDCDDNDGNRTPGKAEQCDGRDNDCDQQVDEELRRDCGNRCGSGQEVCRDGRWADCTAPAPQAEACNGRDDDCDGQVDQGLRRPCFSACGDGEESCVNGTWQDCTARQPLTEECNNLDDDCDGATDEGLLLECESRCGSGVRECRDGAWQPCNAPQPAVAETCGNGRDDDCNGTIDDGCQCEEGAEQFCGPDQGTCVPGVQRCQGGRWSECLGGQGPIPEVCNGRDDDCDGFADEGNVCGEGEGSGDATGPDGGPSDPTADGGHGSSAPIAKAAGVGCLGCRLGEAAPAAGPPSGMIGLLLALGWLRRWRM